MPYSEKSMLHSDFTLKNLQDFENHYKTMGNSNQPEQHDLIVLRQQVMNAPNNLNQELKKKQQVEYRRTQISHKELIHSLQSNPSKLFKARNQQSEPLENPLLMEVDRPVPEPSTSCKVFKKQQSMTMRQKVIQQRYR